MSIKISRQLALCAAAGLLAASLSGPAAFADEDDDEHELEEHETYYVRDLPAEPSEAWVIAMGGRLYDNWVNALDAEEPEDTHPAWPSSNTKKEGATTWRCKSCHGWDLRGKDGAYGTGSYKTGIKGVRAVAGMDPIKIEQIITDDTHKLTREMIPERYMVLLTTFLSKGQYDIGNFVSDSGEVSGDPGRGKAIFQNTCAACHGYDGRALNWGDDDEPGYVGTEANANPWEVFFKIRHGHPGVEMISLAAFGHEEVANVLAYTKTLPKE